MNLYFIQMDLYFIRMKLNFIHLHSLSLLYTCFLVINNPIWSLWIRFSSSWNLIWAKLKWIVSMIILISLRSEVGYIRYYQIYIYICIQIYIYIYISDIASRLHNMFIPGIHIPIIWATIAYIFNSYSQNPYTGVNIYLTFAIWMLCNKIIEINDLCGGNFVRSRKRTTRAKGNISTFYYVLLRILFKAFEYHITHHQ